MNRGTVVLDTSALLALLHKEPGYDRVQELLSDNVAIMSAVNAAEVLSKHQDVGIPPERTLSLLSLLGIEVEAMHLEDAALTAQLRPLTKSHGLSLGDRACLALGVKMGCPIVTADRVWGQLPIEVPVIQIRQ